MTDLAPLFKHLIEDRPGNFAARIVAVLVGEWNGNPLTVEVKTDTTRYTFVFNSYFRPASVSVRSVFWPAPDWHMADGPVVEAAGWPNWWTPLERFRFAEAIDRAFRGHGQQFDSKFPEAK